MRFLMEILNSFGQMSRLKINLEKSALLGINCTKIEIKGLVREIGNEREDWPTNI